MNADDSDAADKHGFIFVAKKLKIRDKRPAALSVNIRCIRVPIIGVDKNLPIYANRLSNRMTSWLFS